MPGMPESVSVAKSDARECRRRCGTLQLPVRARQGANVARAIRHAPRADAGGSGERVHACSQALETDADLLQQLVAEIGSQRPRLQKKHPGLKTTEGRPRKYYFSEKSDSAEVAAVENVGVAVMAFGLAIIFRTNELPDTASSDVCEAPPAP